MNELQRIELLDTLIWTHVSSGLTALATEHYLNYQFYGLPEEERKKSYKTNVANTVLYQANNALIDSSIVKVVEQFKSEDKISKIPFEIPDMEELRKHRIVISHPSTIKFSDSNVQKFYDADLHYKDPKAIRFWRVRDTIIKKIEEKGGTVKFPNKITVQLGTLELIHGVMASSAADGYMPPPLSEMAKSVYTYFKKYEEAIRNFANN